MIGCLWTRVRKQPIIALYFESELVLKFYNLEARRRFRNILSGVWGREGGGVKFRPFLGFNHHILQRGEGKGGEGICTIIRSGPSSACQRNAISMAFRRSGDDGAR